MQVNGSVAGIGNRSRCGTFTAGFRRPFTGLLALPALMASLGCAQSRVPDDEIDEPANATAALPPQLEMDTTASMALTSATADESLSVLTSAVAGNRCATCRRQTIVYVSDGMRQDLVEDFATLGKMPFFGLARTFGTTARHGMLPAVPSNSAVGWDTLLTGASAASLGVTNNVFHRVDQDFGSWEPAGDGFDPGNRLAQTLVDSASASGRSVAVLNWVGYAPYYSDPPATGPVLDYYPDWLTGRGIVANYNVPNVDTSMLSSWLTYQQISLASATDWVNPPASYSQPKAFVFPVGSLNFQAYVYDSTNDGVTDYDRVLLALSKDGSASLATLTAGTWSGSIKVTVDTWSGPSAGGLYFKLLDLTPSLSRVRLYFTPVVSPRVWPQALKNDILQRFDAFTPDDYGPYLANLVDAETFVQQTVHWYDLVGMQVIPYILRTYHPDLALVGNLGPDDVQHRFLSRAMPGSSSYDPVNGPTYWRYIQAIYAKADAVLGRIWSQAPLANIIAVSDHGFSPTSMALNAEQVLINAGLSTGDPVTSRARAYVAGGTAQIYISLQGRNPNGLVPQADYELVQTQIVNAFNALPPGLVERVLRKDETAAIDTVDGLTSTMLDPLRTGDVVVFAAPPYQFDAAVAGTLTAPAPIYGQHGFVPNGTPERYSTFVACGPDIKVHERIWPVKALDIAPTVARLLGIPAPAQAEGRVLPMLREP
jgi:predicted AlkP superfamily phosphohydrolase/phosphomutase